MKWRSEVLSIIAYRISQESTVSFLLRALGIVGDEACGKFIFEKLGKFKNIDTSALKVNGETSFTDVMYDSERRTRAYFQFRGSNSDLCIDDFDFEKVSGSIMHVGYLLLLDTLDSPHPVYGTKMGEVLHKAQSYGIKTSIDIVSEESDRYRTVIAPALKYVDYCIINEMEAGKIVGIPASDENGHIIEENMPKICKALRELGVSDWIIVHARDASYGLDIDGTFIRMDCIDIPRSLIAATTGAGDAFCAGALYGAYKGMDLKEAMYFATGVASCSLFSASASDGVRTYEDTLKLCAEYPVPACESYKI